MGHRTPEPRVVIIAKVAAVVASSVSNYIGTTDVTSAVKGMNTWSILPAVSCAGVPTELSLRELS